MLINVHGHHLMHSFLDQDPYWGPFWEPTDDGAFRFRIGDYWMKFNFGKVQTKDSAEFFAQNFSPERKLAMMDQRGVDKLVISMSSAWYLYWTPKDVGTRYATLVNEEYARFCSASPDRLYFWGHLPMQDPQAAIEEVDRAVALGARGFGLGGRNMGGYEFYSREYYPLWEKLCALDLPLFIHGFNQSTTYGGERCNTDDPYEFTSVAGMPYDETGCFWHLICGGVLDDFPALKVYITHGGGMVPYQLGRLEGLNANLKTKKNKKPLEAYLDNFYFDPLVHGLPMRRAIVETISADRLLYGDNFGGADGVNVDLTEGLGLSASDREKIRSGNAMALLKLA